MCVLKTGSVSTCRMNQWDGDCHTSSAPVRDDTHADLLQVVWAGSSVGQWIDQTGHFGGRK